MTDLEKNKEAVRSIYYYHAYTQGWGDIGYNALVDGAGNVYEGRYGTHEGASRENPTAEQIMVPDVEAGHTAGYNQGSFGVAAMGDFTRFNVPTAQLEGLKKVLTYVADERGVNVQGNSDFRRYDGTWHLGLNNLIGHRDAVATACPGEKLYEELLANKEDTLPTYHDKILIAKVHTPVYFEVNSAVNNLLFALQYDSDVMLVEKMKDLVPEYISSNSQFAAIDGIRRSAMA